MRVAQICRAYLVGPGLGTKRSFLAPSSLNSGKCVLTFNRILRRDHRRVSRGTVGIS